MYLLEILGYPAGVPKGRIAQSQRVPGPSGVQVSRLLIDAGRGEVPAILLMPEAGVTGAAVLYAHAHGNRYDIGKAEVLEGRPAILDPPLGVALARAGHLVLCPDMPGFGERQEEGSEESLAKSALWQGRCLLGDMLADLSAALDGLSGLPEAVGRPVGVVGISMGATLAYWLGAMDGRISGVAQMCVMADIAGLISDQVHDLHGIYMTVPGFLRHGDMGDVAAMVAPRMQVIGAGLRDPLTPANALFSSLNTVRAAYAACPDRLIEVLDPTGGHAETPAMRRAVMAMLAGL